jgi:hypothetical protein
MDKMHRRIVVPMAEILFEAPKNAMLPGFAMG